MRSWLRWFWMLSIPGDPRNSGVEFQLQVEGLSKRNSSGKISHPSRSSETWSKFYLQSQRRRVFCCRRESTFPFSVPVLPGDPWWMKWCFPSCNAMTPKPFSSVCTLPDTPRSNVFPALSILLSSLQLIHTISHHSTCKKLSSYEWPCWPSMTLAKWEEPVPERYVGASLQWGLVSWSHQLIKYKNRHTSGSTDRRGLQRTLPLFPAISKWSFPMRSLFWFLLILDCLFQN